MVFMAWLWRQSWWSGNLVEDGKRRSTHHSAAHMGPWDPDSCWPGQNLYPGWGLSSGEVASTMARMLPVLDRKWLTEAKRLADQANAANGDGGRDDGREEELENLKNQNRELQESVNEMKRTVLQLSCYCGSLEGRMKQAERLAQDIRVSVEEIQERPRTRRKKQGQGCRGCKGCRGFRGFRGLRGFRGFRGLRSDVTKGWGCRGKGRCQGKGEEAIFIIWWVSRCLQGLACSCYSDRSALFYLVYLICNGFCSKCAPACFTLIVAFQWLPNQMSKPQDPSKTDFSADSDDDNSSEVPTVLPEPDTLPMVPIKVKMGQKRMRFDEASPSPSYRLTLVWYQQRGSKTRAPASGTLGLGWRSFCQE